MRVEDVAIGFAISLGVGLLLWPRGARAALRESAAQAYTASADYLAAAATSASTAAAQRTAGAATRTLDDTYRQFLAERGHERLDMGSVGTLISGATRVRLAAYSLMSMAGETGPWEPSAALDREVSSLRAWFGDLAEAIRRVGPVPNPQGADGHGGDSSLRRLSEAVQADDEKRIPAALGAALASQQIKELREFEAPLARALGEISRGDEAA